MLQEVEDGIAIPDQMPWQQPAANRYFFKDILPGQSRLYPDPWFTPQLVSSAAHAHAKRLGIRCVTRWTSLGCRVWFVAAP